MKSTHKRTSSSKAMKVAEDSDESSEDDDDEKDEIAYLARRISKAWIKRKKKGFVPKKDKKKG